MVANFNTLDDEEGSAVSGGEVMRSPPLDSDKVLSPGAGVPDDL